VLRNTTFIFDSTSNKGESNRRVESKPLACAPRRKPSYCSYKTTIITVTRGTGSEGPTSHFDYMCEKNYNMETRLFAEESPRHHRQRQSGEGSREATRRKVWPVLTGHWLARSRTAGCQVGPTASRTETVVMPRLCF
jgi:hypothetical protein